MCVVFVEDAIQALGWGYCSLPRRLSLGLSRNLSSPTLLAGKERLREESKERLQGRLGIRITELTSQFISEGMMSQEFTFRLAQTSDFDEILKLSEEVYAGHDYLPLRFHTWMNMENLDVMLAFSGEKLVSLVACSVVDDGKTHVTRAARTLREFRGRGIYRQLLQAMEDFVRTKFPSVLRRRFIIPEEKATTSFEELAKPDTLVCFVEKATIQSRQFSLSTVDCVEIQSCTMDYLCSVIFSSPLVKKLFLDGIIVVDCNPLEPVRSNIDYLIQEYGDIYVAVEKSTDDASPKSVSFGLLSPRVKYNRWTMTTYCSDSVLYEAHLLHQLKRACEVIKGDFFFSSSQDKTLTNSGRRALKELLDMKIDEDLSKTYNRMRLYEVTKSTSY